MGRTLKCVLRSQAQMLFASLETDSIITSGRLNTRCWRTHSALRIHWATRLFILLCGWENDLSILTSSMTASRLIVHGFIVTERLILSYGLDDGGTMEEDNFTWRSGPRQ